MSEAVSNSGSQAESPALPPSKACTSARPVLSTSGIFFSAIAPSRRRGSRLAEQDYTEDATSQHYEICGDAIARNSRACEGGNEGGINTSVIPARYAQTRCSVARFEAGTRAVRQRIPANWTPIPASASSNPDTKS